MIAGLALALGCTLATSVSVLLKQPGAVAALLKQRGRGAKPRAPCSAPPTSRSSTSFTRVRLGAGAADGSRARGSLQRTLTEDPFTPATSLGCRSRNGWASVALVTSVGRSRPAPPRCMRRTRWASPRHAPCAARAPRGHPPHAEARSPGPPWM